MHINEQGELAGEFQEGSLRQRPDGVVEQLLYSVKGRNYVWTPLPAPPPAADPGPDIPPEAA